MNDASKWTKGERARIAAVESEIRDVENMPPTPATALQILNLRTTIAELSAKAEKNVAKRRKSRVSRAIMKDTYIGLGLTAVRGSVSGKTYYE